ncbi:MAG: AraC family transcriptional regulator [Candidatus Sulfotelmatobacter sp.]|jgi:AraC-like DNA-binding protein
MINSYSDCRVRQALQIIDREPNQAVAAVAQQLGLSKSRFSHLFKAQTGTSVKSYVVRRRLHEAGHLLRTTGMEIKEIVYRLGYHHGPSFARVFKAQFGVTPNQYRKAGGFASATDSLNRLIPVPTTGNAATRGRSETIPTASTTQSSSLKTGSLAS